MRKLDSPWVTGMASGAVATLVMSMLMVASKRSGVMTREYPPRKITREMVEATTDSPAPMEHLNALTTANHFAYGMAGGAVFAWLRRECQLPGSPFLQGLAFGLLVWAGSYMGWVPAARIMPPPEEDQPGRVGTMVAAHVVYGSVLGKCQELLEKR